MNRFAEFELQLSFQVGFGVLCRASANHQQETGPLEAEWAGIEARQPPVSVFLQKARRIDDIVMIIDAGEEILHERIWPTDSVLAFAEPHPRGKYLPVVVRGGRTCRARSS